jgi:preprotein translocase subunit SecB
MTQHLSKVVGQRAGIKFARVYLREVAFDARKAEPEAGGDGGEIHVNIKVVTAENKSKALVELEVELRPKDDRALSKLKLVVEGEFVPQDDASSDLLEEFALRQGPALVFPFAREMVANLTARAPGGVLLLPPVNLYPAGATQAAAKD